MRAALLLLVALGAHAAAPDIIVEAAIQPSRVYVGGEALLSLRLLRAEGVSYNELMPPDLGDAAQVVSRHSSRSYREVRSGVSYFVLERNFSVIPKRAGTLALQGGIVTGLYRGPQVTLPHGATQGPALSLAVLPARANPWLPARRLTLEETWSTDPSALASGAPVTRTLVLFAEGVTADRLPVLEVPRYAALRAHYDRPEAVTDFGDFGLTARRVQRIVLLPVDDGVVELPEIRVSWWDVVADVPRVAVIPARRLRVSASLPEAAPVEEPGLAPLTLARWMAALVLVISAAALGWHLRTRSVRDAREKLRSACHRNDPRGARDALADWEKAAGASASVDRAPLDAAIYGGHDFDDGAAFWRAVEPQLRRRPDPRPAPPGFFRLQPRR
ncbi:MAG: hypothetical protein ACREVQ_10580 [Burkholderiales bacterium]